MAIQFHLPVRGQRFFDGTLPRIARALEEIARSLGKQDSPCDCEFDHEGNLTLTCDHHNAEFNRRLEWELNQRPVGFVAEPDLAKKE